MADLEVVEICAGAGGQALGLEFAGFEHALAVELDAHACNTLRHNRPNWKVAEGDVASPEVWKPADYQGVALLAGGVPCPPFTIAGKQLGATDERDLFAWAIELCGVVRPRALLLENVRGLSMPRFGAYRQHVIDRLRELGYIADWQLLQAADYGVPQLRPRFVLVALHPDDAPYFRWPDKQAEAPTVGATLVDLMESRGWRGAKQWAKKANKIAPTIVGGSKKHGGADLGPTRAKRAWLELGVNALGVANEPPAASEPFDFIPMLTNEMVARIQGWTDLWGWEFTGRKTSQYRQIGNAFPPPVAEAVGAAIHDALQHKGEPVRVTEGADAHDPIYNILRQHGGFMTAKEISKILKEKLDRDALDRRIGFLSRDFHIDKVSKGGTTAYRLGEFKAFLGQSDHSRHQAFLQHLTKIS